MYVLDTNVISELRKIGSGRVDPRVEAWVGSVSADLMFLSVITVLELETGALLMERRDRLQGRAIRRWISHRILPSFAGKVLLIDVPIALKCAAMNVPNRRPNRDAWIAATALVHGMTVVTRNVADFEPTGVTLVNPWLFENG